MPFRDLHKQFGEASITKLRLQLGVHKNLEKKKWSEARKT
jgi:hypothetical protein